MAKKNETIRLTNMSYRRSR